MVAFIVGGIVVVLLLVIVFSGYKKAPPDTAYIISGLRKKVIIGKASVKIPFLERMDKLSLKLIAIDVKTSNAVPTADYINIQVDDEDSLSSRLEDHREVKLIDIAVIRLPRISNFTDFNPFEMIEGVSLRYVKHAGELGNPDMVILPGTKNTMEDLLWMRQNGLEASIFKLACTCRSLQTNLQLYYSLWLRNHFYLLI